jgi:hypothetical protein
MYPPGGGETILVLAPFGHCTSTAVGSAAPGANSARGSPDDA